LVITNCLTGGGAERSMNLLVNELHSRGIEVALMPINKSEQDLVKPICPIFPLNRTWNGNLIDFSKSYVKFLKILKSWKPDVAILNCDLPELFGALSLGFIPRLIAVEHSHHPFASRVSIGKITRTILKIMKTEFVSVSSHLSIWQVPTKPQGILLNAIKPFNVEISESNLGQKSMLRNVMYVGRLATQKRPQMMIEISRKIQKKVVVIGEGEAKDDMILKIQKESLNVEMLGYVKNPWEHFEQGDLLIVPSLFEGDGMVVIEAIEHELRVPSHIRSEILGSRTPKAVGDSWVLYLDQKRN
jgi:glycosyltransferase involved in cell wall biosynthesis